MSNEVELSVSKDIPQDILLRILYKLPVKSLIRFICVSKLWFNLINNHQQFNKFHIVESQKKPILIFDFQQRLYRSRYYFVEKEEHGNTHNTKLVIYQKSIRYSGLKHIVGYSNGLACYQNYLDGVSWELYDGLRADSYDGEWVYFSLEFCNPSTVEKLVIVSVIQLSRCGERIHGFRIGYNLLSNEYKVMCITKYKDEYKYYIFTLGSTKPWRKINNPWPEHRPMNCFHFDRRIKIPPISCHGYLFYETVNDEAEKEGYKHFTLVSFDLQDEKFQIIKLPDDDEFVLNYNNGNFFPSVYKGCLCYARMKKSLSYSGKVVLHILKDEVNHVWEKEIIYFVLPRELDNVTSKRKTKLYKRAAISSSAIVIFSNQVILYWRLYDAENGDVILFYNVHSKELKEAKLPYVGSQFSFWHDFYISSHVENFFSLKTLATTTDEGNTSVLKECIRQEYMKEQYVKYCAPNFKRSVINHMTSNNIPVISFIAN